MFYKDLFGLPHENMVMLDTSQRDDISQVREEENIILIEGFIEEEVEKALF
jgi:hypothetical protein